MKKNYFIVIALFISIITAITSCVKKDFDVPPDNSAYDPRIPVTHSIKEIQDLPSPTSFSEDWVISGIVNMDDKEGNYFKKITIQDNTGGIEILIDQNNIYNDFPVGRKVYIKLKGLSKSDYNSLPQLGYTPDATGALVNIPFTLISDHVIKASYPNIVEATEVTLESLTSASGSAHLVNKLVVIKNVEFSDDVVGLSIADPGTVRSATNRNLQECSSTSKVVVRTSGFSKFQKAIIPGGKGTITALYTKFGTTPQLIIRNMSDLEMTATRCDGSSPNAVVVFNDGMESMENWTVVDVWGAQTWAIASDYGSPRPCAIMNGFSGGSQDNEDWLISKEIDLSGYPSAKLTFETANSSHFGPDLACFIATDYIEGLPTTATWTPLAFSYSSGGGWAFVPSGDIDLSAYIGKKVKIAFKYTSTTSGSKTWQLDNVRIVAETE